MIPDDVCMIYAENELFSFAHFCTLIILTILYLFSGNISRDMLIK